MITYEEAKKIALSNTTLPINSARESSTVYIFYDSENEYIGGELPILVRKTDGRIICGFSDYFERMPAEEGAGIKDIDF